MNGVYPAPGYSQQIPYQASYGYNPYGNQQRIEQPQNYFQPAQTNSAATNDAYWNKWKNCAFC